MKKVITILLFISCLGIAKAQTIRCNDLLDFIKEKGYLKTTLISYTLNSSWLYKVTAYEYDYKIYVVAEIKENQYSYSTNTYIFCGIPSYNWTQFQYASYGDNSTYGERFHKYIFDYQCNCN